VHAKFRWNISIHCWDKTTSRFGKRTAAILAFYFRFWFWRMDRHRHVILPILPNFVLIRRSLAESYRHIHPFFITSYPFFSRSPAAAILHLIPVILDYTRSAIAGLSLVLKFGLDRMYSFFETFIFCRFGLKRGTHFLGVLRVYVPKVPSFYFPIGPSLRGNTSFEP